MATYYCPQCKNELANSSDGFVCSVCRRSWNIVDGIPDFLPGDIAWDSYDASAFDFLYEMEQKHFWHIGRREMILDNIKSLPASASTRILEIGCGNGSVLTFLKKHGLNVEGGDIFLEGLQYCRRRTDEIPLYRIDISALPFKDAYDIIGLFDILEHLDDDEKALKEVAQALKPGGKLLVTVPAHQFLWRRADRVARHKRRYNRKELIARLQRNGFSIKKASYFISLLFPFFLLLKVIDLISGKRRTEDLNALAEMKTYPVLNTICLWLLRLENRLIRHISLPLGASLVVLAEKD